MNSRTCHLAGMFLVFFALMAFGSTAAVEDVGTSLGNIADIAVKYFIPGLALLVVIWGIVDMMTGMPGGLKKIIIALIGVVLALSARAIIMSVTGQSSLFN